MIAGFQQTVAFVGESAEAGGGQHGSQKPPVHFQVGHFPGPRLPPLPAVYGDSFKGDLAVWSAEGLAIAAAYPLSCSPTRPELCLLAALFSLEPHREMELLF